MQIEPRTVVSLLTYDLSPPSADALGPAGPILVQSQAIAAVMIGSRGSQP